MVSTRKHDLTVVDSVFMYGLLLVRDGQTWPHHADDRYMANECIVGIDNNFWTSPIWPQCGGDRLSQVTTKAGSIEKKLG